jgi:hypothetical protein
MFKIVNESVKKTDKHDAATIREFKEEYAWLAADGSV